MPEIGTSGSMSGDGKRGVGHRPQATAPILDSTRPSADMAEIAACEELIDLAAEGFDTASGGPVPLRRHGHVRAESNAFADLPAV